MKLWIYWLQPKDPTCLPLRTRIRANSLEEAKKKADEIFPNLKKDWEVERLGKK